MNRIGIIVAILQFLAALEALWFRDYRRCVIYLGFAVGSAAIAWR